LRIQRIATVAPVQKELQGSRRCVVDVHDATRWQGGPGRLHT